MVEPRYIEPFVDGRVVSVTHVPAKGKALAGYGETGEEHFLVKIKLTNEHGETEMHIRVDSNIPMPGDRVYATVQKRG